MNVIDTKISDVKIIEPAVFGDKRGFFMESFHKERYARECGITLDFVQDNVSQSEKGVLRGLHYQKAPHAQGKLVSVLRGRVFDVAVDIRHGCVTFGQWVGVELSGENKKQFWVPPGCAHGYLALEDDTLFAYKCTDIYAPQCDAGIIWDDPDINVAWPLEENSVSQPLISQKDRALPLLKDAPKDFTC